MVKIIQMSIILTYDVTGKLWEIPKKLKQLVIQNETPITNLQRSKDQQYGEVDLDDHVNVIFGKDPGHDADKLQSDGRNKNCQSIADQRPPKCDFNHNSIFSSNLRIAHSKLSYEISIEGNVSVVIQIHWHNPCEICVKRKLHQTDLCVKGILVHVVLGVSNIMEEITDSRHFLNYQQNDKPLKGHMSLGSPCEGVLYMYLSLS